MTSPDDLPAVDTRLPDDLLAELQSRFGETQLTAYTSLARSRGIAVLDVLRAAADDTLALIIASPKAG